MTGNWEAYDQGHTLGLPGAQGGTIIRDEEHSDGARITLERDCLRVPYAITCQLYGFGDHTRFIADEPTALHAYGEMQAALAELAAMLPGEDEVDPEATYNTLMDAFAAFAGRYR